MKKNKILPFVILALTVTMLSNCGRDSSPEGRMEIRMESLQKEMLENQKQQNAALLDSLSSIRKEIQMLQQRIK